MPPHVAVELERWGLVPAERLAALPEPWGPTHDAVTATVAVSLCVSAARRAEVDWLVDPHRSLEELAERHEALLAALPRDRLDPKLAALSAGGTLAMIELLRPGQEPPPSAAERDAALLTALAGTLKSARQPPLAWLSVRGLAQGHEDGAAITAAHAVAAMGEDFIGLWLETLRRAPLSSP
ncbi:MAG: hypothetical protein H6739_17555 [Alphaproteobacteria bacterium]|nr:hypothetical protein [Alphaproteobacteria bacterium]